MYKKRHRLYRPDAGWIIREIFKILAVITISAYLFYNSFLGIIILAPIGVFIWRIDDEGFICSRKKRIREEFKDMITFLSGNLNAGYSLENSFEKSVADMDKLHGDKSVTASELKKILHGVKCNRRIEELFDEFGVSSGVAEIRECAGLIAVTKVYGGDLIKVIHRISRNLSEQCVAEGEIASATAAKRLEGGIMLGMPFFITAYMRMTNAGYMDIMYEGIFGRTIMTAAAGFILASACMITKITKIEV